MASSFESTILTSGSGDDLLALVFPPTVHRVSLPSFAPPPQLAMVHASRSQSSLGELLTRPPNAPVPPAPPGGESSAGSAPDLSLPPLASSTPGGSTDALAGPPAHLMASMGCLQRDCNEPLYLETACRVLVPVPTPGASASTPNTTSPPSASPGHRLSGHLDSDTKPSPRPISPAVSFIVHTMEFPATLEINDTTFFIRGDGFPEQTYQLPAARVSLESEPRVEIHEMNPPYRVLFESASGSTTILLDSLVLFVDAIRKINRKLRIRKRIREDAAAVKIQRAWRTHVACTRYLRHRRAALRLQSWYRRHRLRHALLAHVAHLQRALSRRDQRARIINEMVTTEESYIQNLDVLVRVCLRPLRSLFRSMPGVPITAHHIDVIFGNVEAILDRHTEFYEALVAVTGLPTVFSPVDGGAPVGAGRSWSPTGHIKDQVAASSSSTAPVEGDSGVQKSATLAVETITVKKTLGQVFCDMATWLDVYIPYCNNYNDSKQELDRCLKVREFAGYLESVKSLKISQKNDLASFLILPVQRVPRYELLLKTLIRNTEPDDPELRALERALDRIHHAAQVINRAKMYNEARPHLHEIVKGMRKVALTTGTGPLAALGDATSELAALLNSSDSKGQFLGEGPAWYSTSRSAKAIAVYLYLFVGQLIVTVPKGGLLRGRSDNGAGAVGGAGGGPASSGAAVASTAAGLAKNSKLKFLAWIPLVHAQVFDSDAAPPTVASPSSGPSGTTQGFSFLDPDNTRLRTASESSASTTHSPHLGTSLPGRSADPSPERSPSPARREHAFVIVESVAADPAEALLDAAPMCHKFTVDSRDAKMKWVDQVSEAGMMAMLQPRSSELSPDFDKLHGSGSRPASPTDRTDRWWRMTPPRAGNPTAAGTTAAPAHAGGLGDDDQARTWLWRTATTAGNASGPTRKPSSTGSARESSRTGSPRGTLKRHSSQNSATKMGRSLGDLFSSAAHVSSSPIASTDDAMAPSPPDASFRARSSSNASSTPASVVDSNLFRRASGRSPPKASALAATAEEDSQLPVPVPCALKERAQSTTVLVNSLESAHPARHAAAVAPSNESLASSTASGNLTIARKSGGSGWRLGGSSSKSTGGGGSLGAVGGVATTKQRSLGNLMAFLSGGGDRDKDKDKEKGGGGGGGGSVSGSRPASEDSVRGPSP